MAEDSRFRSALERHQEMLFNAAREVSIRARRRSEQPEAPSSRATLPAITQRGGINPLEYGTKIGLSYSEVARAGYLGRAEGLSSVGYMEREYLPGFRQYQQAFGKSAAIKEAEWAQMGRGAQYVLSRAQPMKYDEAGYGIVPKGHLPAGREENYTRSTRSILDAAPLLTEGESRVIGADEGKLLKDLKKGTFGQRGRVDLAAIPSVRDTMSATANVSPGMSTRLKVAYTVGNAPASGGGLIDRSLMRVNQRASYSIWPEAGQNLSDVVKPGATFAKGQDIQFASNLAPRANPHHDVEVLGVHPITREMPVYGETGTITQRGHQVAVMQSGVPSSLDMKAGLHVKAQVAPADLVNNVTIGGEVAGIQAIVGLKRQDTQGLFYSWARGRPQADIASALGVPVNQIPSNFADMGPGHLKAFTEKVIPTLLESIVQHDVVIHKSQLGNYKNLSNVRPGPTADTVIANEKNQAVVMNSAEEFSRDYKTSRPTLDPASLKQIQATQPEMYNKIMEYGAPIKAAYESTIEAALVNAGEARVPKDAYSLTRQDAMEIVSRGADYGRSALKLGPNDTVPPAVLTANINQAQREWVAEKGVSDRPIQVQAGNRKIMMPSQNAREQLQRVGDEFGYETAAGAFKEANLLRATANPGATVALKRAGEDYVQGLSKFAGNSGVMHGAIATPLPSDVAVGGQVHYSAALAANQVSLPGKVGGLLGQMAQIIRQPLNMESLAPGQGAFAIGSIARDALGLASDRIYAGAQMVQRLAGDFDADRVLALLLEGKYKVDPSGNVLDEKGRVFSSIDEINAAGQRQIEAGAGDIGDDYGQEVTRADALGALRKQGLNPNLASESKIHSTLQAGAQLYKDIGPYYEQFRRATATLNKKDPVMVKEHQKLWDQMHGRAQRPLKLTEGQQAFQTWTSNYDLLRGSSWARDTGAGARAGLGIGVTGNAGIQPLRGEITESFRMMANEGTASSEMFGAWMGTEKTRGALGKAFAASQKALAQPGADPFKVKAAFTLEQEKILSDEEFIRKTMAGNLGGGRSIKTTMKHAEDQGMSAKVLSSTLEGVGVSPETQRSMLDVQGKQERISAAWSKQPKTSMGALGQAVRGAQEFGLGLKRILMKKKPELTGYRGEMLAAATPVAQRLTETQERADARAARMENVARGAATESANAGEVATKFASAGEVASNVTAPEDEVQLVDRLWAGGNQTFKEAASGGGGGDDRGSAPTATGGMFGRGGRPPGAIKGWLEGDPEKGWSFREVKTDPVALARQTRVMGDVTKAALAGQTIDTPEMAQEFLEKANLPTGTWDSLRRLSRIQAAGGTFGERDASMLYKLEQDVFQQAEKATKVLGPRDATGSSSRAGLQPMYDMVAQIRELATDASKQAGGGARGAGTVDKFTKAMEKSTRLFGDNFKTVEKFGQAIKETTPHLERIRDITGRESITQSMRGQLAEDVEMLGVMKGRIVKGLEPDKALVAAARDIGGVSARREILTRGQRQAVAGAYQRARVAGPVVGDIGGRTFDARQRLAEVPKQSVGWKQLMSISYLPWQLQFSKLWGGEQSEQALAATAGVQQLQAQAQRTMGLPAEMDIPSLVRERQARTAQAEYFRGEGAAGAWAGPGGEINKFLAQHPGAARTVGGLAPKGPALSYALIGSIVLPSIVAVGKSVVGKGAAMAGVGISQGGAEAGTKALVAALQKGVTPAAAAAAQVAAAKGGVLTATGAGLLGGGAAALVGVGMVGAGLGYGGARLLGYKKGPLAAIGDITRFEAQVAVGMPLAVGGLAAQALGLHGVAHDLGVAAAYAGGLTGPLAGEPLFPTRKEPTSQFEEALQRVAPDLAGQMTPPQIATAELSMARAGVRPEVMGGPAATYGLSYLKMADMGGRAHELEKEFGLKEGEIGAIGRQHLVMTGESGEEVVQGMLDTADAQKAAGKDPSVFIEGYMRSFQAATMGGLRAGMDTRQIEALRTGVATMDAFQDQKNIEERTLSTPVAWSNAMRKAGREDLAFVDGIGRPTYFGLAQSQQKAQAEHGWAMTRMQYGASSGEVGQAGEMVQFQWGTDMLPGGGDGGAIPRQRAISDQLRDINRGYQSTQMDFNLRQGEINLERRQWGTGRGYEIQQGQWQMQWDALHRQQETFGLAERSNEIQREMFETKLGWRQEDIGKQMTRGAVQFDWQREDWAVNRNTAGLQFGWQQEDFDESIRYASGRERVQLKKKRERSVTMYNVQQGQMDRQEERGTQQYQWSREDQQESLERLNEEAVLQRELLDIGDQRLEIQKQDLADAEQKLVWRREEMEFAQSLAKDELILAGERQEFALTQKNDLVEIRGLEDDLQTIQRDGEDLGATHQKARYDAEKTFYDEFIPDAQLLLDMQQEAERAHALFQGWVTEGWENFGVWILNNMAEGKPVYEALKSVSDLMGTISPEAMQDFEQQMADVLGDACEGEGGVPGCWR